MTRFQVGDLVVSMIDAQNLTKGEEYEVADIITSEYPWGVFVTYVLESDGGDRFAIRNGHLVLQEAAA